MDIADLKDNLRQVVSLKDNLFKLKKGDMRTYSLSEYLDLFQNRLIRIDHGERDKFYWPMHVANTKLDILREMDNEKFNSDFSTNKSKMLSIVNQYIKDLQIGFEQNDLEAKLNNQGWENANS